MKGPSPVCKLVHAAGQRYTMVSRRKGCPLPSQTKQAGFLDEGSTCEESLTSSRRSRILAKEPNTTQILDRLQRKLILLIHLLLNKLFSQISNCTPLNLTKQIIQKNSPFETTSFSFPSPVQRKHHAYTYTCFQIYTCPGLRN